MADFEREIFEQFKKTTKAQAIEMSLKEHGIKEHLLFLLPSETGIDFNEMLNLKWSDIGESHLSVSGNDVLKARKILLSSNLKAHLEKYAQLCTNDVYVLGKESEPMESRKAFYSVVEVSKKLGFTCYHDILRRMFGHIHYKEHGTSVKQLTKWYGFANREDTLDFIGVIDKHLRDIYMKYTGL
jgi:site-specific recombinase XerD